MVAAAACSSSNKTTTAGTTGGTSGGSGSASNCTAASKVPDKIKSAGSMNAATDASYAPNEFIGTNGSSIEGMDIDLGNAIAKQLNLTMKWQNVKFDDIIPGIGTRYDISLSSFSVTAAREKQVCMVSYFSAGTSFYVETGKNQDLTSLDALCGKTVAVETGTTQQDDATAQSKKCTDAGKSKVTVLTFPDQNGANLALSSGRADVVMADSPVAAYAAKQSDGKFEVVGQPYGTAPYGIVLPNTSEFAGLSSAVLDALKTLDQNGTYKQILTKWGVQAGAISDFAINPASS
jgi:polar amino acid transport system substrate-binding protein